MKESLVEVSPSTVMQLNERSAACFTIASSAACDTAASVAMKPSMVAMFGLIMPAPLLMPLSVTGAAVEADGARRHLGHGVGGHDGVRGGVPVAFVEIAMQAGRPFSMRSTGSGSMMTPVENGSTCSGAHAERARPRRCRWRARRPGRARRCRRWRCRC
jgi:hypothetical protein